MRRIEDRIAVVAWVWIVAAFIILTSTIITGCGEPYGLFPWVALEKTSIKHKPKKGPPCPVPVIDEDEDGVEDDVDNCPGIFNPFQEDSDQDGIGSACDDDEGGEGEEPSPSPTPRPEDEELSEAGLACLASGKAWVCHHAADNVHNVCVGEPAVGAHLNHGDTEGDCNV